MSAVATAIVGGAVIGGYMSSSAQEDAANTAANAQTQAAAMSTEEQRRQFDKVQALLAPYNEAGVSSLTAQRELLGLSGPQAQANQIYGITSSPQYKSMLQQGENSILQNASATGGLRGGNVQGALAQFAPNLLSQLIDQQYSRLGGITSLGQNAAAMTGNAGMNMANQVSQNYQQAGAASAGAALAAGKADAQMWNTIGSLPATLYGSGAWKGF